MKSMLLAFALVLLGTPGYINQIDVKTSKSTKSSVSEAQCKYTLKDAQAGLQSLTLVDFVPRRTSDDGKMVLGLELFHNPKSTDEQSIDAIQVVVRDADHPNMEVVFVVVYNEGKTSVKWERVLKDKKEMTPCFDKTVEKN